MIENFYSGLGVLVIRIFNVVIENEIWLVFFVVVYFMKYYFGFSFFRFISIEKVFVLCNNNNVFYC